MTMWLFISSLCFVFLFSACQKEDNQSKNSDVLNASCEGSVATIRLWKHLDFAESNAFGFTVMSGGAFFSDEVIDFSNQNQSVFDVGDVKLNGTAIEKGGSNGNTGYFYTDTVATASGQVTWSIDGGNGYPAFSHETANSLPTFTLSFDKDSIGTTEDLVINFDNLMDADSLEISIDLENFKTIAASNSSLTITSAELASLNLFSGFVPVNVVAFSRTTKEYGDKEVCFTLESERRTSFIRQ